MALLVLIVRAALTGRITVGVESGPSEIRIGLNRVMSRIFRTATDGFVTAKEPWISVSCL